MSKQKNYEDYSLDELYEEVNRIDKKANPDTAKQILDEITLRHEANNRLKSDIREAEQHAESDNDEGPGVFSSLLLLVVSIFILGDAYKDLVRGTAFLELDPFSMFSPETKFGFRVLFGAMILVLVLWNLKEKFFNKNEDT